MAHDHDPDGPPVFHGPSVPVQPPRTDSVRVPGTNVIHFGDQVREWTDDAVRHAAARDPFMYDVALTAVPAGAVATPEGIVFQTTTVYLFVLYLPSVLLRAGKPYSTAASLGEFPDRKLIQKIVREAAQELRLQRANDLRMPHK